METGRWAPPRSRVRTGSSEGKGGRGVEGPVVAATAGLAAVEVAVAMGLSAAPEAGAREAMAGTVRVTGRQGLAAAAKANKAKMHQAMHVQAGQGG